MAAANPSGLAQLANLELSLGDSDRSLLVGSVDRSDASASASLDLDSTVDAATYAIAHTDLPPAAFGIPKSKNVPPAWSSTSDTRSVSSRSSVVSFGPTRNLRTGSFVVRGGEGGGLPGIGEEGGGGGSGGEEALPPPRPSLCGSALKAAGGHAPRPPPQAAIAVGRMDSVGIMTDIADHDHVEGGEHPRETEGALKRLRGGGKTPDGDGGGRRPRLTTFSRKYDLDGDGALDEVETAMRDRDVRRDGQLGSAEVYKIVQDRLRSERDVRLYAKVAAGLACLVAVLSLSNFGTSWATATLAKQTEADTGAVRSKATGEVMGFQQVAHTVQLMGMNEEEFDRRRRLVDEELEANPDHERHLHRRLGRRNDKKCLCSKVAYDHDKIPEQDLDDLVRKCDGHNTVTARRTWRDDRGDEEVHRDTILICSPGTKIVRKGKKKRNKHKTKVRVVDEHVTFRRKGKDGKERSLAFDCDRGSCYTSGETLLQGRGHPCKPVRDKKGASQCEEGLFCLDKKGRGVGTCTKLGRYVRESERCDADWGVDACENGFACRVDRPRAGPDFRPGMQVDVGTCARVQRRSGIGEACDASFRSSGCDRGLVCLASNGDELGVRGVGYCARVPRSQRAGGVCDVSLGIESCAVGHYCRDRAGSYLSSRSYVTGVCVRATAPGGRCRTHAECGHRSACLGLGDGRSNWGYCGHRSGDGDRGGWYVDYEHHRCVRSCSPGSGSYCGGEAKTYNERWATAGECCGTGLFWMDKGDCVPNYNWNLVS